MAEGAMLARRPPWATGSWTWTGNGRTCAPILSDWLDKAGANAVHADNSIIEGWAQGAWQVEVIVEKPAESTRRSQCGRSLNPEPIWPAEVMAEKSAESNQKKFAGRGVSGVSRSGRRVAKKRYVLGWSNIKLPGAMADGRWCACTSSWAIGRCALVGTYLTWPPRSATG